MSNPSIANSEHFGPDLFFTEVVNPYVVSNPRFIERQWLEDQVLASLPGPNPFLLLTAEPGAGKSAFLAQLAHKHASWLRYFIRKDQRSPLADVSARSFLLRIGYQLAALRPALFSTDQVRVSVSQSIGEALEGSHIVGAEIARLIASPFQRKLIEIEQHVSTHAGDLKGLSIGELIIEPRLLSTEDLLYLALMQPAAALKRMEPSGYLVILIDALDEIAFHHETESILTWLANSGSLPDNIRFVLTSRPGDPALRLFLQRQAPRLRHLALLTAADNLTSDLRAYTDHLVREPVLSGLLSQEAGGPHNFAEKAISKARGNIGYLDALARGLDQAIARSNCDLLRSLLQLRDIPDDLRGLYSLFFHQIKMEVSREVVSDPALAERGVYEAVWPAIYDRVLGVLAVALEPLDEEQIQELGGIHASRSVLIAALDRLTQFLQVSDGRYRFYHSTVAEFLSSEATRSSALDFDLFQNPRQRHAAIAAWYSRRWQEHLRVDDYGLRNLASHCCEGGDHHTLSELLNEAWMHERVRRANDSYVEFNRDIELLWYHARDTALQDGVARTNQAEAIRLAFRCALIRVAQNSLSGSFPVELIKRAIEVSAWSASRALHVADQTPYPLARAELYLVILTSDQHSLPPTQRQKAQAQAIAAARQIESWRRVTLLAELGQPEELDAAIEKIHGEMMKGSFDNRRAMVAVPRLTKDQLAALLRCIAKIGDPRKRLEALRQIVRNSDMEGVKTLKELVSQLGIASALIPDAHGLTLWEDDAIEELGAMTSLASLLSEEQLNTVLSSVLEHGRWPSLHALAAHSGSSMKKRMADIAVRSGDSWLVSSLAPQLSSDEALSLLRHFKSPSPLQRAEAYAALIPRLSLCFNDIAVDALKCIGSLEDTSQRDARLEDVISFLPGRQLHNALEIALRGTPRRAQVSLLTKAIEHLPKEERPQRIAQGLEIATHLADGMQKAYALKSLAPHLNEAQIDEVLKLAADDHDENAQAEFLVELAGFLSDRQRDIAVTLAGRLKRGSRPSDETLPLESSREKALGALAPYLTREQVIGALKPSSSLDAHQCTRVLLNLVPFAGAHRAEVFGAAVARYQQVTPEWLRAISLTGHFPHFTETERAWAVGEALRSALASEPERRSQFMVDLIAHISDRATLLHVLESLDQIPDDTGRAAVLVALVARVECSDLEKLLDAASRAKSAVTQARVVMSVAERITDERTQRNVTRTFHRAWRADDSLESALSLAILAPKLGRLRALAAAFRIRVALESKEDADRSGAIASLAPHMPAGQFEYLLKLVANRNLDYLELNVIEGMGRRLRANQVPEALRVARSIKEPQFRARSLVVLTPQLDEDARVEVVDAVLQLDDADRYHLIVALAPLLSVSLLDRILESQWPAGSHEVYISHALAAPAAKYTKNQRDQVLSIASGLAEPVFQGALIAALVPFFSDQQMPIAHRQVLAMSAASARFDCLVAMSQRSSTWVDDGQLRHAFVECLESQIATGDAEHLLPMLASFLGSPDAARLDAHTVSRIAQDVLDVGAWSWL